MVASLLVFMSSFVNQERLEYIERDEREYTLDEEDRKVQDATLDRDPSRNHTVVVRSLCPVLIQTCHLMRHFKKKVKSSS